MMYRFPKIIVLLLCSLAMIGAKPLAAGDAAEIDIRTEIARLDPESRAVLNDLNRAIRKMRVASFKSIGQDKRLDGNPRFRVFYQLYDPQSDFTYQRKDFPYPFDTFEDAKNATEGQIDQSTILNKDGLFVYMYRSEAIDITPYSPKYIWRFTEHPRPGEGGFSISSRNVIFNRIPCREFTLLVPSGKVESRRYLVMQRNDFIISVEHFDSNGKMVPGLYLGTPEINANMAVDEFEIPGHANMITANSKAEFDEIVYGVNAKYDPLPEEPTFFFIVLAWIVHAATWVGEWLIGMAIAIFEMNPIFLLVPAALCIPAAILIKRRGIDKSTKAIGRAGVGARRSVARRR